MDENKLREYFGWKGDVDMAEKIIARDKRIQQQSKHWQILVGRMASIANSLDCIGIKDNQLSENELEEVRSYRSAIMPFLSFDENGAA